MSCEIVEQRTGQRPNIKVLPPRELTSEERARLHEYRANKSHLAQHQEQIADEHPNQELLVYGGDQIVAFDSLRELFAFRERLDKPTREASYHPHRGWSGNIGPIFRVTR